ncbi:hypothetical protein ABIC55_000595 [Sporosarcina psychrophila]|uniref:Uncharacterized protein n=1 Tax=Sporosarcina psychrophila TaxID=1476 RepID=A0ABV2K367_SPOPS
MVHSPSFFLLVFIFVPCSLAVNSFGSLGIEAYKYKTFELSGKL